jgi:hypothetical protein
MPDLQVTDDLARRFSELDTIAGLSDSLRQAIDKVNALNIAAGGTDDYGRAYHAQVDTSTSQLSDLVSGVGTAFSTLAGNGADVTRGFNTADEAAHNVAGRW